MIARRGTLSLCLPLLLAAGAVPLHAQFTTEGCPNGPQAAPFPTSFTAGTPGPVNICLLGSFSVGATYNVQLFSPLTSTTVSGIQPLNGTTILVSVPASFFATVSYPNQPDPVIIDLAGPVPVVAQNGSFQINPPLQAGGPVFVSPVGSPTTVTMYSFGSAPYHNSFINGVVPPGMASFPTSSPAWTGTPNTAGVYQYAVSVTDAWGNVLSPTLYSYIVPVPTIVTLNPPAALAGAATTALTINGSGFLSPTTVGATPEPGSTVLWGATTPSPIALTPTSTAPNQLTVNVPTALLTGTGIFGVQVVNPSPVNSNTPPFTVTPSVTGLSTRTRTASTSPFALGVTGTGFVNGSMVEMNGRALATTFVNGGSLTATFPTDSLPGSVFITVLNPDTTLSPAVSAGVLTILAPPTTPVLSPTSVNAGGPAFQLAVTGGNYLSGMTVYFAFAAVPTILNPAQQPPNTTQLLASIPASLIGSAQSVPVWVATVDGYVTGPATFTINAIAPPPLQFINVSPLPGGMVNSLYTDTFTATGGVPGYTFASVAGTLPPGLQLSSSGILNGTPTTAGAFQFTVQVTDSTAVTSARAFALNIAPPPLTLTSGPLGNTLVNTPVSVQFAGSGGVPPYTFVEFGALPPGTRLSNSGLLSGTPTQTGAYPFLLYIYDSANASASQKYSLTVMLPGLLITTASPLPPGQLAVPYSTTLAATGGVGPPYVWYASGLPQGLTMAGNTGLIAGIPRAVGTFTVGVTVADASGLMETQNYTLVIGPAKLTVTTPSLPNGAVGSSYSASVSASGGAAPYTFTAAGLPPGVTLTAGGILSGSPTTAGNYNVAVTATDSQSTSASAAYSVTIAGKLVVTAASLSNAVLGSPIAALTLSATGGTPPYQWQTANAPPGLTLASNGTLSGIPTSPGTYSVTVLVVDSNGALASGTVQVTVGLPAAPAVTISGLPATNAPATQPSVQVGLANPYPVLLTANLTLTFTPNSGADDPAIQFSTGGRTAQIVIPANTTGGLTAVGVQIGTVAGAITVTVRLLAGAQDVTPSPAPTRSIVVSPSTPVITAITATRNSSGFAVVITGYSSTRDLTSGTYLFSSAEGATLATGQVTTSLGTLFATWYQSSASAPYGSQFTLTQPFTVTGDPSTVLSVTLTLTNSVGTSPAATANLQ